MQIELFKKLGFNDKSAKLYLALLRLGPSSVRKLAEFCGINRGTTYDALKWLKENGIVDYYNKDTKQTFVAESPEKLHDIVELRKRELNLVDSGLAKMIPELSALYDKGGGRPVARYYEKGYISKILQNVIDTCENEEDKMYRIYSTEGIREYLYEGFETFSDVRVSKGIRVKVIAIGHGGELRGLDERKWLVGQNEKIKQDKPTYIFIYPGNTAYISFDAKEELIGVVIENKGIYETQKLIFDELWNKL